MIYAIFTLAFAIATVYYYSTIMMYLYVGKNRIKLLAPSKTLLGQYNVSYFQKIHENDLLKEGKVANIDLLASAIKEAVTMAKPKEPTEKDVSLILSQDSFTFLRLQIPKDISETAVASFVEDKLRSTEGVSIDDLYYSFLTITQKDKTEAFVYGLKVEDVELFQKACKLLGLSVKSVLPETLCYFKLFEKTLRAEKRENILYVYYGKDTASGYLYDSFGLAEPKKYSFESDNIESTLKELSEKLEENGKKLNRIILSGSGSESVRQDHFTKSVGVWTNPLKKIILNFYEEYVRMLIVPEGDKLPFLDLDSCVGAFIFTRENKSFSLLSNGTGPQQRPSRKLPKPSLSLPSIRRRDAIIFALAFALSFTAIFAYPRLSKMLQSGQLPLSKAEPTTIPTKIPASPTPIPEIVRSELKIRVLNGIGVAGRAGEVKDILVKAGYEDIVTDNADSFDFTNTKIRVKKGQKSAAGKLREDLLDNVKIEDKNVSSLEDKEAADIELIIGEDFQ